MTDLWWLPFLVGYVPVKVVMLYATYCIIVDRPRDCSRRERLGMIDLFVVFVAPIGFGACALGIWWSLALLMGVTP